jgi:hypothetical protein
MGFVDGEWVSRGVPMWLRVVFLFAILGWSIYFAIRHEKRVLRRLAKAARRSVGRALVVVTAFHLAIVAVLALCGLAAAIAHRAGWSTVTIVILLIGLAAAAPFMWLLAPSGGEGSGPATPFRDLRRQGAPKNVARAIAYPAVAYHFLLVWPAMLGTGIAVILVE